MPCERDFSIRYGRLRAEKSLAMKRKSSGQEVLLSHAVSDDGRTRLCRKRFRVQRRRFAGIILYHDILHLAQSIEPTAWHSIGANGTHGIYFTSPRVQYASPLTVTAAHPLCSQIT